MSVRPNDPGSFPRSGRCRSEPDSSARLATWWRVLSPAQRPRRRGRSWPAHVLAAGRSQGWLIAVNDSVPACPNTVRSQSSLPVSVSQSSRPRRASVRSEFDVPRRSLPRPGGTRVPAR